MSEKSLIKITNKYNCMVSGEKRMNPCSGCTNPNGCVSKNMQYKENETMDEKAIVKIDADGVVQQCAKGLDATECGFKAGAKVCGACGALPVMLKQEADLYADDFFEEDLEEKGYGAKRPKDSEDIVTTMAMNAGKMDTEMADEDMEDEESMAGRRKKARAKRITTMGMKSEEWDDDAFMCSFERKMYPGGSTVCANCPGGCATEGSLPGLLEMEGVAEDMFGGKVLDSGYSDDADLFVIDVERKDGKAVEAFFDGSTGECTGWHLLADENISEKTALHASSEIISFDQAAVIATKSIQGEVIAIDPEVFEGFDSYVVEIEGLDGKSYDVYVALDGEVLGYDEYTTEEAEEIEAEAAEIALKRAYSEETRMELAKEGISMEDGSFPIKDEADLRNAIRAYGRAKDKDAAKAHIMKRAMALKLEELIPLNWVPKKVQEEFAGEKKDATDSDEFLATLMEFELLAAEDQSRDILGGSI